MENTNKNPQVGNEVTRLGSQTDYTVGRKGTVVEVNEETGRARVKWHTDSNGKPFDRNLRTWIRFQDLKID